jgi:biotin-(acetyl-CoA carboxylase) ligase
LESAVTARLKNREYTGIFKDIDSTGALRLEMDDKTILDINAGEVYFPV